MQYNKITDPFNLTIQQHFLNAEIKKKHMQDMATYLKTKQKIKHNFMQSSSFYF